MVRAHVIDRALAVHALLAAGKTPHEVQRRLGRSKGYVSVLGYLGQSLVGLEPDDLARLRHPALTPRVVWPLVTRTRTDERAVQREALGTATTDAARENARRRARDRATVQLRAALRAQVQTSAAGVAAPPKVRGGRRARAAAPNALATLAWDPAAWAADPVAYARAHLAALVVANQAVIDGAVRLLRRSAAERALDAHAAAAGEAGLRRLVVGAYTARWRALADAARVAPTPAESAALAALRRAQRQLRDAGVVEAAEDITAEDLAADLAE
jgi:hypothetical protein